MSKFEKSILEYIEKHIHLFIFILVSILGILIRYVFRANLTGDSCNYLIPWYDTIKANGFSGLSEQVGDYNMLYQFLIACMAQFLPLKALYAYKLLSCIFDYLLAVTVGVLIYKEFNHNLLYFVLSYSLVILCPTVFLNSAAWGQCDSIYITFIVLALLAYHKENYIAMFIFYGVSFSFKLQAIFVLPIFLFVYLRKKNFSILHFLLIPVTMLVTALPNILLGAPFYRVFTNYLHQTDTYNLISLNYPSFWRLLIPYDKYGDDVFLVYKRIAICTAIGLLALLLFYWIMKRINLTFKNVIYMAFLSSYLIILFLPAMHERYGYIYEILALLIIFYNHRTIPLAMSLFILTTLSYGKYLISSKLQLFPTFAFINVVVFILYLYVLTKEMLTTQTE